MAKYRSTIKKVDRAERTGFEDQLWPTNLALLVLTGFVAGTIIAAGGFDDPRWLHNGWVRLVTLGVSMGALLILAQRLSRKMARRLQFAAVVSLIFHTGLAVYLAEKYLAIILEREGDHVTIRLRSNEPTQPTDVVPATSPLTL